MKSVPFILRDHRDDLWRRWGEALDDRVEPDYRELVVSPLGGRMIRTLLENLIAYAESEEYELPGLLKRVGESTTVEARHHLTLGFAMIDIVVGLHVLRGTIVDVLVDALVLGEMPAFADSLDQLKATNAFLDHLVCATMAAA